VQVLRPDGFTQQGTAHIGPTAPGIFTANASGTGVVSAGALAVGLNGAVRAIDVFACGADGGTCSPVPIEVSNETIVLSLYGTGVRGVPGSLKVIIGGLNAEVLYAGAQGQYAGLDQINAIIPRALKGRGIVDVVVLIGGRASNFGKIQIR
jgi:uncharacterized protein (TIGR03437 family)